MRHTITRWQDFSSRAYFIRLTPDYTDRIIGNMLYYNKVPKVSVPSKSPIHFAFTFLDYFRKS